MSTHHLHRARKFAQLMDSQFSVFGIRFGLDSLLGFFPGGGDLLGGVFSLYLLWIGYSLRLPAHKTVAMISNILLDTVLGSIPLIGDIGDLLFKANLKNLEILEDHVKKMGTELIIDGEIVKE